MVDKKPPSDNEVLAPDVSAQVARPPREDRRTRIQQRNEKRIIELALKLFATQGFRGTTVDQIAAAAGMSKANVLYYFNSKAGIYRAVLEHTITDSLRPTRELDPAGDPIDEICAYAMSRLQLARESPAASRLFALEIIQGARVIGPYLKNELKREVDARCAIVQGWIDEGRLARVEPLHLLFMIWSVTQHYAEFRSQLDTLYDSDEENLFRHAEQTLRQLLAGGLAPANRSAATDQETTQIEPV